MPFFWWDQRKLSCCLSLRHTHKNDLSAWAQQHILYHRLLLMQRYYSVPEPWLLERADPFILQSRRPPPVRYCACLTIVDWLHNTLEPSQDYQQRLNRVDTFAGYAAAGPKTNLDHTTVVHEIDMRHVSGITNHLWCDDNEIFITKSMGQWTFLALNHPQIPLGFVHLALLLLTLAILIF